jgi:hypothetical protein
MGTRAEPSGLTLTAQDAALIRGMIARGDRHHDIAAFFGVNQGRIAEVREGTRFPGVPSAEADELPPEGPVSGPQGVLAGKPAALTAGSPKAAEAPLVVS